MTLNLSATERKTGQKSLVKELRKDHKIPAVLYGHGTKNQNVTLDYNEFRKIYDEAGTSSLIDLTVDGSKKAIPVLISEIQKDPVTNRYSHIDFFAVRMDEKLKTDIELEFVGESPAVKNLGANLVIAKESIYVECLPSDLVSSIIIDISVLKEIDDSIHLKDITIPKGITVLDDPESSLVSVLAKQVEEVVPTVDEAAAVAGIVVEGEEAEGATEATETAGESEVKEEKKN